MNTNLSQRIARTAAVSLALLSCGATQAQSVRKCQVDGRLVYQSSPCPVGARVASAAPQAAGPEPVAVAVAAAKKKGLADLLRERDGAAQGRPPVREAQADGASVLRSRMGAV